MNPKILEYIDFEKVNTLLEGFNQSTGFVTAILDLEGNILSKSGWRRICTEFHRLNPETSTKCTISDTVLAGEMKKGEKYHFYKCLNGLVDVAVPIVIKGEHIANLFSGQFFFEKPDRSFFQKQAVKYGFNETLYLKALDDVPVISEEKVKTIIDFLLNMTQLISDMTYQRLELMELYDSLQASKEHFQLVLENSMDAIFLTSPDGSILSANPAACQMFKRSEEEICRLGRNVLVDLSDPRLPALLQERNRTGKAKGEILMLRKDGTKFPVELSTSVFTDKDGNLLTSLVVRDITERIRIENELRESKERLNFAFEGSNDGLWDVNMETGGVYINSRGCEILGYLPDEMEEVAKVWSDLVHPDDLPLTNKNLLDHIENRSPVFEVEQRLRMKSGDWKWVLARGKVVSRDATGKPLRMTGTHTDISERVAFKEALIRKNMELESSEEEIRAANEELKSTYDALILSNKELETAKETAEENEKQFSAAFYSHPFSLSIVSVPEGKVLDVNNACCEFYGYTREQLLNFTTRELQLWDNDLSRQKASEELATTGRLKLMEAKARTASNELRTVLLSAEPIIWKSQKCIITSTIDISERKLLEQELVKAKEKAEESNRLKTAFLQNMSHEIRTPMNAIMGFSELLVHNFNDKTKLEYFSKVISQRCNDLLIIIDDILDIAKIESGQLSANIEKCDIGSLFSELETLFTEHQKKLNKQHIKLVMPKPGRTNLMIETDPVKLKQIFINLIGNAFKFTSNGMIEVGFKFNNNKLIFFVADTGIGIPAEKQQIIFERFIQIEPSENRLYGGNGLGLSIVKGLVDLLGGEIWLESEVNKGSTFYFSLPFNQKETFPEKPSVTNKNEKSIALPGKTVLIVEDDIYNAEFIKEVLSGTGVTLFHTQLGIEAVQMATSQPVDLVLMDIGLPDINGFEAIRQIKQRRPNLKIIAQTAYASSSDKQNALEAGCVDYISKPLKSELLKSLINKHLL